LIKDLLILLENLIDQIGPLGIAIATFIESLIAPIPSEVVLVFAGATLANFSEVGIFAIAATAGSYMGTLPFYLVAYKSKTLAYKLINKYGKYLFITQKDVEEAEAKFSKNGKLIIFTGRLIPGIRSLISIPAGICKMNFAEYTIYTLSGSFIWNILLLSGGYLLRDKYKIFIDYLEVYEKLSYGILILVALSIFLFLYMRNRKK
jgi:membrane protein DedA with SNARE-associated domain